jgi:RNA polymerase sigma-70 factor (ECF subfamily)
VNPPRSNSVELDGTFFRREAARLLASLVRVFGAENLALAEDVVQDTLAGAFEEWTFHGVPEHYSALLMTSAKNRAIDVFRRERTARKFAPELRHLIESEWTLRPAVEELFLPAALKDDELRMMFSCCHPQLHEDAQVALMLRLVCGFGVGEIASIYLSSEAAIEKRIARGKKVLAASRRLFELTAEDFEPRLSAVHRALYLLFSEGYHGASAESAIRAELCREAMRLVRLLVEHAPAANSTTHALAALMALDAARLPGRTDEIGELTALLDQDRARWNADLIAEGLRLLELSAAGNSASEYHVEAAIAGMHACASRAEDTRWSEIVALYDALMRIRPSPVVALNRAMALAQALGPEAGLQAIREIVDVDRLNAYPFYEAALGELELRCGRREVARAHLLRAQGIARNPMERRFLARRIGETEK